MTEKTEGRIERARHRGFLQGVLAALYVVQAFDADVIYDEIARDCGPLDDLYAEARRTGNCHKSGLKEARSRERSRESQRRYMEAHQLVSR